MSELEKLLEEISRWRRLYEAKCIELAKTQSECDAARDNAELMNAAASRYLRRAEQAEAKTQAELEKRK